MVGLPLRRSHDLLEAVLAAPAFDHDAPIDAGPDHGAGDLRLSGERPEPIPDRRLECVAELVASGSPLDVDQLVAVQAAQNDPVDTAAPPGAAAERHHRDGGAALLELIPDRLR